MIWCTLPRPEVRPVARSGSSRNPEGTLYQGANTHTHNTQHTLPVSIGPLMMVWYNQTKSSSQEKNSKNISKMPEISGVKLKKELLTCLIVAQRDLITGKCNVCDPVNYLTLTDFCRVVCKIKPTRSKYRNFSTSKKRCSTGFHQNYFSE